MTQDRARRIASIVTSSLVLLAGTPALADVLVFDRAAKTVSRLDAASLAVKASASLPAVPTRAVVSPDGKTVVVLCRGEGDEKYDGFKAKTKSQAVLLEAGTLKESARVELGWGLGPSVWDAVGTSLVVLAPGFPSTNPEKHQPATVVSIDREGKARRVTVERAAADLAIAPDGSVAAVLASRVEGPAQLSFCDLATGTAGAPILLGGEPKELLLAPDGATLYALSRGKPKGFGNVQGSLAVFSLPERKKTAEIKLGAITGIGGFEKGGRLILGGGRAGEVKEHRIYVVRGTAVEYDVAGPDSPTSFRFGPEGRTAWALGWTSALVDFGDFSAPPVVTVSDISGWGGSFERTPDGKLALVHSSDGKGISEVLIYELPAGKKLKKFDTASFGSRLVAGLAAGAATFASMEAGRRDAEAHGQSTYSYSIYGMKTEVPRGSTVVIRPDGKVAYVYDPVGSEILLIDLEKLEKGKRQKAGEGSRGLFLTGSGRILLIAANNGLSVFDTTLFGEAVLTKTDGPADLAMGPSGEALLLAKGLVAVVDPATGKVGAKTSSFREPAVGAFLP
jgi:DNA-binding beta-propeller fold protein YncE